MYVLALLSSVLLTGCRRGPSCHTQLKNQKPEQRGEFGLFMCKQSSHPFLSDHERVLMLFSGEKVIDTETLYSSPGGSLPLHYVIQSANLWTAIDVNGYHYSVDGNKIKDLGWQWMAPLPDGTIRKIRYDPHGVHTDEIVTGEVSLDDIYWFKDND